MANITGTGMQQAVSLKFLGHNGFLVESSTEYLAIDPWLTDNGAFHGSWFQYPKNHHLQAEFIETSQRKKGWIYISHEHQDHFDVDTLSKIGRDAVFVIPRFRDDALRSEIDKLGFQYIELLDGQPSLMSAWLTLTCFVSDIGVNHDSALLIETPAFSFFNQNDCKIFDRLDQLPRSITYYSVQFSGATWHPVCYENYSESERAELSKEKSIKKLDNVVGAMQRLKPRFFIPAAGPAIFPFLPLPLSYGVGNIFIHQPELHQYLLRANIENILYPRPGDEINELTAREPIAPPRERDILDYKKDIADRWEGLAIDFSKEKLIDEINNRLDQIWDLEFQCESLLVLALGDGEDDSICIDLSEKAIINPPGSMPAFWRITADKKYFALMCGRDRWQNIHLSLRAKLYRAPDRFDNIINIFLLSDVSNLRDSILQTLAIPKGRIMISRGSGIRYEINRYCPHQGADLSCATITEDGKLICPRHGWAFSLEDDGKALDGSCSLEAKIIELEG
ncbi:Rieske 2Fe-2S domain-containing protein [Cupriavidus necator]